MQGVRRNWKRGGMNQSRTEDSGPGRKRKTYKDLEEQGCQPSLTHLGTKCPDHPKGWSPMGQLQGGLGPENPRLERRRSTYEKRERVTQTTHHGGHPASCRYNGRGPG